jgi:acyl-CoA-binding protein
MKTIRTYLIILGLLFSVNSFSQQIGEVELKKPGRSSGDFKSKDIKDAPKKIYIAEFWIAYQLVFSDQEETKAGASYGKTKSSLTIAIANLKKEDLTEVTNNLYSDFKQNLEGKGYEIVKAVDIKGAKPYEGWELLDGGTINEAQIGGYVYSTPNDYQYYVKKVTKKGKSKSSFLGYEMKLSQALDGTLIAKVNIMVPFIEDAESGASKAGAKMVGGVSKIVVRPSFRIMSEGMMESHNTMYNSKVYFGYSPKTNTQNTLTGTLKKPISIDGVFEDKKYKSVATASANSTTGGGAYKIVTSYNVTSDQVQIADCDPTAYKEGVFKAAKSYMDATLDRFYGVAAGEK